MKKNIKNIQEIKGATYPENGLERQEGMKNQQEEMDDNQFFQIVKRIVSKESYEKLMTN